MTQSMPNLRTDTVLRDISATAARSADNVGQTALIQALVQQLRQLTEEGARAQVYEDRAEAVKAFDWVTQKPAVVYYPVSPAVVQPSQISIASVSKSVAGLVGAVTR